MQDEVTEMNPELKLVFLYCTLHQGLLCKPVLMNHVTDVVTKIVHQGKSIESQTVGD